MNTHGGDESGIVRLLPGNLMLDNKPLPLLMDIWGLKEHWNVRLTRDRYIAAREGVNPTPFISFGLVATTPKLNDILGRQHEFLLQVKCSNRFPRFFMHWMIALEDA